MAKEADIPVVRGPVEDVLGRFVEATADLPDEALVVRLTADNVFPDADLIGMIVDEFLRKGTTSLVAATPESGLPYGLAAEVFRCGVLREAAQNAVTQYQREHVTPWINRDTVMKVLECPMSLKDGRRCVVRLILLRTMYAYGEPSHDVEAILF